MLYAILDKIARKNIVYLQPGFVLLSFVSLRHWGRGLLIAILN